MQSQRSKNKLPPVKATTDSKSSVVVPEVAGVMAKLDDALTDKPNAVRTEFDAYEDYEKKATVVGEWSPVTGFNLHSEIAWQLEGEKSQQNKIIRRMTRTEPGELICMCGDESCHLGPMLRRV